ncbi:MAG TPA: carboxymuconolactone decarboxylase family protein [Methylomusa anaerophila]|uniref:Carboxymuconolactone decarboxylase family protein n=1 Tax=Methylomusa anaerophila TaxID=1930071 RepID=A0A348AQV1_9FIRM|nr:carboxymuconolactone decarboxylase family protein [Methylomusa anaerophila]BBB93449.1 carboxymuconolactone decarboxylase family protein [Methylomusa anaerophila]HML90301.1 carboxymuconolactone decarboxylase family protein [Methylomusa anaerophila]
MTNNLDNKGNSMPVILLPKNVFGAFMSLAREIESCGPLSKKEQELILLGTVVMDRSEHGIALHAEKAYRAGATRNEILHAIVCCLPVAGLAKVNEALEAGLAAVDQLEKAAGGK